MVIKQVVRFAVMNVDEQSKLAAKRVAELWPDSRDQARAWKILDQYTSAEHARESPRVVLAILKLSDGSLEELARMVEIASTDYRDVLAWAEYPGEMETELSLLDPSELTPEQRRELREIKRRDREQYRRWLSGLPRNKR